MVYTAFWQNSIEPQIDARVAIRVSGDPERALPAIQRAVSAVDRSVPVTEILAMPRQMRAQYTEVRLGGAVLVVGAALALFLSAVGLYGVVSFLATQRTREIGVRLAVGARPVEIITLFVRQGMRPIWIGGVIGLGVSVAAAPLLSRWLFGVTPLDPASVAIALASVSIVAFLACFIPARRAAQTDPASVFRFN
jgi:putative ABC transport system permease protein